MLQVLLTLEDLYIRDQRAWHQANSLEEVYEVINQNVQVLLDLIDKTGFIDPHKFGKKAAQYFYTLIVHADFYKDLQKEYLQWLKKNKLDYLDVHNLNRRITELRDPLNLSQEEFLELKKERFGRPIVSTPYFEEYPNIRGFYSTTVLGDLRPKNLDTDTLRERRLKLKQLVLQKNTSRLLTFTLLNGDHIIELSYLREKGKFFQSYHFETADYQLMEDYGMRGDAIIVSFKDIVDYRVGAMGAIVGDCYILTLWDKDQRIVAQVHLGVPGFTMGLLDKLLNLLKDKYDVPPEDLYVLWGPGIHKEKYIYTDVSRFINDDKWSGFIIPVRQDKDTVYQMDLLGAVRNKLLKSGVKFDRYLITPVDTYTNPFLFSHARSLHTGQPDGRFFVGVRFKGVG